MSISSVFANAFRATRKIDEIASEVKEQERAVMIAARFSRGNVNGQYRRLLTPRIMKSRLDAYVRRFESKGFVFSKDK